LCYQEVNNLFNIKIMSVQTWQNLLQKTSALDIVRQKNRTVIEIEASTNIGDALKILASNDILSAPVTEDNKVLGFVDTLDLTGYILAQYKRYSSSLWNPQTSPSHQDFLKHSVKSIINFSQWDDAIIVMEHSSLHEVIECLAIPSRHFIPHRVAVFNTNNQLTNIISQSDILSFIHKNISMFPESVRSKTVTELNIAHPTIMVRIDDPFSDAISSLYHARVSGIALVDHQYRLSANLSASDLRGILPDGFDYFSGSTLQFLVKGTETSLRSPIICDTNTSFENLIQLLMTEHVHRIYVTNQYDYPTGVISLSDIIRILH